MSVPAPAGYVVEPAAIVNIPADVLNEIFEETPFTTISAVSGLSAFA
jgi:hypothetical protein